ncbi:peptidyl-tRNA hydrolase ICT1, mitochondrial [Polistes fuscatus]|uniref:peptidyl-tRNA hydrolase ICT1, mitochondrial n=1 Tax=Polistes fuscatus TaxID=30207 RepID=UPI001CA9AFB2|nr:peptidyl-tRNA hydrolase ICT1, mitochondrial [Polistes fuscatus]
MNLFTRQCLRIFKTSTQICINSPKTIGYKSAFSLENLYPGSSLKLFTANFVPEDPSAKFNGYIPIEKLNITYNRSSGPGGQHVNTVNTKVDLRFNVEDATWLSTEIKKKLLEQQKNKINKEGFLIIKSDLTRSQQLNLADALEKLRTLIWKTVEEPPQMTQETEEIIRKRQLKAARERIFVKRIRSQIKQSRQGTPVDF